MKNLYLCLCIFPLFLSCSNIDEVIISETAPEVELQHAFRSGNELPFNPKNSYDMAGAIYYDILEAYRTDNSPTDGLSDVLSKINSIAATNSNFQLNKGSNYSPTPSTALLSIIEGPVSCVAPIISRSGIGTPAKSVYSIFLQDLNTLCKRDEEEDVIYDFIISFEDSVNGNTLYNLTDKKVLLTSASIARYAIFKGKRKPKKNTDQDWDWLIAGIAAGTEGISQFSMGNAITMSATVSQVSQ